MHRWNKCHVFVFDVIESFYLHMQQLENQKNSAHLKIFIGSSLFFEFLLQINLCVKPQGLRFWGLARVGIWSQRNKINFMWWLFIGFRVLGLVVESQNLWKKTMKLMLFLLIRLLDYVVNLILCNMNSLTTACPPTSSIFGPQPNPPP